MIILGKKIHTFIRHGPMVIDGKLLVFFGLGVPLFSLLMGGYI